MRRLLLVLAAAAVLAGCGTTELHGGVGDALKGDHVQAKLLDYVPTVPKRMLGHDYSGLNAPPKGMRFAAAQVAVCNDTGAAAIEWRFELRFKDGARIHPNIASSVYDDMMDTVREGCDSGWLVFPVPVEAQPESLYYEFDWSHNSGGGTSYTSVDEEHDRFFWSL